MLRETWSLGDVRDVEAFCGDVIAKFTRGERVAHQAGSDAFFSPADKEDLLAFLLATSWQAWLKFNPIDDGRGTNKFSGYLIWILHRRLVDWIRKAKGSTRYSTGLIVTELVEYRPELHDRPHWDTEYDDGSVLDLEAAPDGTRDALELLRPLIDEPRLTQGDLAVRGGVPQCRVAKAVRLVREEAIRQGLVSVT